MTLIQLGEYQEAYNVLQNCSSQTKKQYNTIKLLETLSLIGLKRYEDALKVFIIIDADWRMYLCKAFTLYCLTQYEEALSDIENVQQISQKMLVVYFLNSKKQYILALILLKLNQQTEATQFLSFIRFQITLDKEYQQQYQQALEQVQQINCQETVKNIEQFILRQIVSQIETLEADEQDIDRKISRIDSWLLTVDFQTFIKDIWWLFNYDQKKKRK